MTTLQFKLIHYPTYRAAAPALGIPVSIYRARQTLGTDEIVEFCRFGLEMQLDVADRPVPLLGDNDFRGPEGRLAALLPAVVAVVELVVVLLRAADRLAARQVIFLAEDEHHDVGVLLDRAGFAQIGQHRPLVLALLDGARQLRQRQDRHLQLLRYRLQPAGDLGYFLDAVFRAAARGGGPHQL